MYLSRKTRLQTSETAYVGRLRATVAAYLTPLEDNHILTEEEVCRGAVCVYLVCAPCFRTPAQASAIFRNLRVLRDVHSKLNETIQGAAAEPNAAKAVSLLGGELLLAKDALADLYVSYARGQRGALDVLRRTCESRPQVARALAAIAAQDERAGGLTLEASLEAPLVRASQLAGSLLPAVLASTPRAEDGYAGVGEDEGEGRRGAGGRRPRVVPPLRCCRRRRGHLHSHRR